MQKILFFLLSFIFLTQTVSAKTFLFFGEGCPYCTELRTTLSQKDFYNKFQISEYEIYYNSENKDLYLEKSKEVGYTAGSVPLIIDGEQYREGTEQILAYLENKENKNFKTTRLDADSSGELLNLVENFEKPENLPPEQNEENDNWKIILIIIIGFSAAAAPFFWQKWFRR